MESDNPFAAPAPINPYAPTLDTSPTQQVGDIYRSGKTLVMHKSATLPDYCFKSNEPTSGYRLKRKLSWHNPWIALTILFNVLIYILIAILVSKRATVMIPLSDRWRSIRHKRILNAWLFCLGGISAIVAGVIVVDGPGNESRQAMGGLLMLAGVLSLLFGILYGMFRARIVRVARIDDNYVHLLGAHPEFLNRFESRIG